MVTSKWHLITKWLSKTLTMIPFIKKRCCSTASLKMLYPKLNYFHSLIVLRWKQKYKILDKLTTTTYLLELSMWFGLTDPWHFNLKLFPIFSNYNPWDKRVSARVGFYYHEPLTQSAEKQGWRQTETHWNQILLNAATSTLWTWNQRKRRNV